MKITSAAANKIIKSLEDEKNYIILIEEKSKRYTLAESESVEPPHYDYELTQKKLDDIDRQVRKIKHAVNCFNTTTVLEKQGITIDEALVYMAQLTKKKSKLDYMRKCLPKMRSENSYFENTSPTTYDYANYNIEETQKDYLEVSRTISEIQMELDFVNQTKEFIIEV